MPQQIQREFNIKLKKFDMNRINKKNVIALLGRRGTGKSTLVKDILYYVRDIPVGTVISPTEEVNRFYSDIVPPIFIHGGYNPSIVEKFVERQKYIAKKHINEINRFGRSRIDPHAFIILDDCMYDDTWTRDSSIRFLFMNGRHVKALFLFTMQYPLGVPPALRTNIDFSFILKDNSTSNRKKIYEHYAGVFPKFEVFCEFMNQCTQNYECLVIDNTADSNNLEDMVFWYKADTNVPDFKIGSPEYWKYSGNFDNEEDDDDFEKRQSGIRRDMFQKRGPSINVEKTY